MFSLACVNLKVGGGKETDERRVMEVDVFVDVVVV